MKTFPELGFVVVSALPATIVECGVYRARLHNLLS
jgi:hypothetical protein